MGRRGRGKAGRVLYLGAVAVTVTVMFGLCLAALLLERLRAGRGRKDVHPGEPRVYTPSDFRSMDERRDA